MNRQPCYFLALREPWLRCILGASMYVRRDSHDYLIRLENSHAWRKHVEMLFVYRGTSGGSFVDLCTMRRKYIRARTIHTIVESATRGFVVRTYTE